MNAISKRLLSWLCVIAMVLSFVPVMDLSGWAVTTKAAGEQTEQTEKIEYGSANYEGVDKAVLDQMKFGNGIDNSDEAFAQHFANKTCPVCGDISGMEGGGWVPLTAAKNMGGSQNKKYHFYYEDSVETCTGNMIGFYKSGDNDAINNTACVWLKSTNNITNTSNRCVMLSGEGNTVNFFGQGTITTDIENAADSLNMFQLGGGTLNLYGGNFIYQHPQVDFRKAAIRIDGASAVANIYAGAKIGPATQDTKKVCQNVQYTKAGTVNMFGGEIRNGVTPGWGYSGNVTVSSGGTFNMYGGTITSGTSLDADHRTAGTYFTNVGGNVVVGGKNQETLGMTYDEKEQTWVPNYSVADGTFNMYGGTITGGKANNGGNGGGNLFNTESGTTKIVGGKIIGGKATATGGNIQAVSGSLSIGGTALISGGEAGTHGGNIYTKAKLTIDGGRIENGVVAGNGGNIYVYNTTVNLNEGTEIVGGTSNSESNGGGGGNLYIYGSSAVVNSNAVIKDGKTTGMLASGGNVNMATGVVLNIKGGEISGGKVLGYAGSAWGGNIRAWNAEKLSMSGGMVYGGYCAKVSSNGSANIGMQGDTTYQPVLEVTGGVIVGDVNTTAPSTYKNSKDSKYYNFVGTKVILGNDAKIVAEYPLQNADGSVTVLKARKGGLSINRGAELTDAADAATNNTKQKKEMEVDISGLTNKAQICISPNIGAGQVIALASNAEQVADCFTSFVSKQEVVLNEDKTGLVVAATTETEAQKQYYANVALSDAECVKNADLATAIKESYCPICGVLSKNNVWTDLATKGNVALEGKTASTKFHYYLDGNVNKTYSNTKYNAWAPKGSSQTFCLAMVNDPTITLGGMLRVNGYTATINIMGEGTITGTGANNRQLGLIAIQRAGTVNLYGGTYLYTGEHDGMDGDTGPDITDKVPRAGVLNVKYASGVVNIHEGVTIGNATPEGGIINTDDDNYNVFMTGGEVNMFGGTIQNGVTGHKEYGGNVHLSDSDCYFNMYGGTIKGGSYINDATAVTAYLTAQGNTTDTEILSKGGNIYSNGTVDIYGGTIENGVANVEGGSIYSEGTLNVFGGTISGGQSNHKGGNIAVSEVGTANIYGGTIIGGVAGVEKIPTEAEADAAFDLKYPEAPTAAGTYTATASDGVDGYGGNIWADGTVNVSGGLIQDGVANNRVSCKRTDTVQVTNGVSKTTTKYTMSYVGYGGNIFAKTFTMSNGTLSGGVAGFGGSVAVYSGRTADISGGTIIGGTAKDGGGNIYIHSGGAKANITGGTVKDGHADNRGGNIAVWDGSKSSLNISGKDTLITNGTAVTAGGNIYAFGKVSIKDSTVSNGFAKATGGNICLVTPSFNTTCEILGEAKIINGSAGCTEEEFEPYFSEEEFKEIMKEDPTITSKTVNRGAYGNGGNIHITTNSMTRKVTIGKDVEVSGGFAATQYTGKYNTKNEWSPSANYGKGANIFVTGVGTTLDIQGTVKDGNAYRGGNIFAEKGEINLSGTVDNGYARFQGGNIAIEGSYTKKKVDGVEVIDTVTKPVLNVLEGAMIQNGTSIGQGGSVRGFLAQVNMSGGEIFGGNSEAYSTDNVWLVSADINMSGGEIKNTPGVKDSGLALVTYDCLSSDGDVRNDTDISTLYLSGNAKVAGLSASANRQVFIDNKWTGVMYADDLAGKDHKPGDEIKSDNHITGTWVTEGEATSFKKSGTYTGKIYYGDKAIGVLAKEDGTLYLASIAYADKDGVKTWFGTNAEALAAYKADANAAYVVLNGEANLGDDSEAEYVIELNGNDLTLTGSGKVYGLDNSNDDYEGYARLTAPDSIVVQAEATNAVNGNRYIALKEENETWGFHKVVIKLTHVTLRTTEGGYYYKAGYEMDDVLASRIKGYGVVLSAEDMPGNDFLGVNTDRYTMFEDKLTLDENHAAKGVTSGSLWGILKKPGEDNRKAADNLTAAQAYVYANAYLAVDVNGGGNLTNAAYFMADTENAGKAVQEGQKYAGVAHRFLDVLQGVNDNWKNYDADKQELILKTFNEWINWIPKENQPEVKALLPNIFPPEGE